jgi:hypothetical protein
VAGNGVSVRKVGVTVTSADIASGVKVGSFRKSSSKGGNWNNAVINATMMVAPAVIKAATITTLHPQALFCADESLFSDCFGAAAMFSSRNFVQCEKLH